MYMLWRGSNFFSKGQTFLQQYNSQLIFLINRYIVQNMNDNRVFSYLAGNEKIRSTILAGFSYVLYHLSMVGLQAV